MKKKILVLLLLLGGVFTFAFSSLEAQAEFVDDNTFIVSNADYLINEEDVIEFLYLLNDYIETYELFNVNENYSVAFLEHINYGGFNIDFNADINDSNYKATFKKGLFEGNNIFSFIMLDANEYYLIDITYTLETDEITLNEISLDNNFTIIITFPEPEPEPAPTIFGFFKNFYENYIFPDDMLDTQTLNFISAITTMLFFIGLIRGIWSIFRGRRNRK